MTDGDPRLRPVAEQLLDRDCAGTGMLWTWDALNQVHQLKLLAEARILLAVADEFDPLRKGEDVPERGMAEVPK